MAHIDPELSLASRAAWLAYVGGFRQEDIATRLGISRVKVNRLIALAHRQGFIRVFVEGNALECVALEDQIADRFGLSLCQVVPSIGDDDLPIDAPMAARAFSSRRSSAPISRSSASATAVRSPPRSTACRACRARACASSRCSAA